MKFFQLLGIPTSMVVRRLLGFIFGKKPEKKLEDLRISKAFEPVYSQRAQEIYHKLHPHSLELMGGDAESLAWVLWAFKTAEQAECKEGMSAYDVSALLYQAAKVELYPINVSRLLSGNAHLVQQVSQEKKSKRYLLSEEGLTSFNVALKSGPVAPSSNG